MRVNTAAQHHPFYPRVLDTANLLKKTGLSGLFEFTRRIGLNEFIHNALTIKSPNPPLDPVTERKLRRYYPDDVEALEVLLGRDLQEWKTGAAGSA